MAAQPLRKAPPERVGEVLAGKWTLRRLLGTGGMAAVYEAQHHNGKRVAIKILHARLADDEVLRARFLREAYVANSIGHPAVVQIDDDGGDEHGAPFLVMEHVEGRTLEEARAARGGRLDAAEVVAVLAQLLEVLVVAHARGVVHRDLKPENLMLGAGGRLRVLDFGLARLLERDLEGGLTQPGTVLGTPHFMAPEQALGRWELVDAATDLWAVGAIGFYLLSGRIVHPAASGQETLARAAIEPAPPLLSVVPEAPPELARAIDRALTYAKVERFADARAMLADLRGAAPDLAPSLSVAEPPSPAAPAHTSHVRSIAARSMERAPPSARPRRSQLLPILLAGGLGAALVWGFAGRREPRVEPSPAPPQAPPPPPSAARETPTVATAAMSTPIPSPPSSAPKPPRAAPRPSAPPPPAPSAAPSAPSPAATKNPLDKRK